MFSLSPSELLTIGIVALIVFGPRRLPELARRAGRMAAYLRSAAEEIRGEVEGDLEAVARPFREASGDLAAAGKALRETAEGELKWVEEAVDQVTVIPDPVADTSGVEAPDAAPGTGGEQAAVRGRKPSAAPEPAEPEPVEPSSP